MLYYLSEGIKSEECNYFYCFREKSLQKENIDVVGCVFETWSKKKCEWMDREVYWDNEEHKAYIVRGEEKIDMTGTIIEDRTFIKMRDFEKLGYTLDWKDMGNNSYIVEIYKDINK